MEQEQAVPNEKLVKCRRQTSSNDDSDNRSSSGHSHDNIDTEATPHPTLQQHLPNAQKTQDLISRLSSFLPQLKAANQNLGEVNESARIDVDLHSEKSNSGDEDDDEDDNINDDEKQLQSNRHPWIQEKDDAAENSKKPSEAELESENDTYTEKSVSQTIQLSFALGDMTGNPMMELLGSEDARESSEQDNALEDDGNVLGRNAVERLLNGESTDKVTSNGPIDQKRKNVLITEL
jgi:hypothetical protein